MKIFGFSPRKTDPNAIRGKYFIFAEISAVRFTNGAPCCNYYLPEIKTYLFDGHKNFALAHGVEVCCETIPEKENAALVFDYHMDWVAAEPGFKIKLPVSIGQRQLKKIARLVAAGMINEGNFTRPFLNNHNLRLQIDVCPPENGHANGTALPYPDLERTDDPADAVRLISAELADCTLTTSFDVDYFYIPFMQGRINLYDMQRRVELVAASQRKLKSLGIVPAYYSVATTSFNFNKNGKPVNPHIAGEVEQATRLLLEEIRANQSP